MKYLLLLPLFFLSFFASAPAFAQNAIQPLPTNFFCVGTGTAPCVTVSPTNGGQANPSPTATTNPSSNPQPSISTVPNPSQNPQPSTTPCSTTQKSIQQNTSTQSSTKLHASGQQGSLQQLIQMILQLLQQIFQQLGIPFPGIPGTGTGNPCPTPSGSPVSGPPPSSGVPSSNVSPTSTTTPGGVPTPTIFNFPFPIPSGVTLAPTRFFTPSPSSGTTETPTPTTCTPVPTCKPVAGKVCPNIVKNCQPTPATKTVKLLASGLKGGKAVCLDDFQNNSLDKTPVVIWKCNSNDKAQQWTSNSDNTIRINGKCLDVDKNGKTDHTLLELFTCNGNDNQKWIPTTITSGAAKGKQELMSPASGKCLDLIGGQTTNQTQVELFTCNGGLNQAWSWTNFTSTQ